MRSYILPAQFDGDKFAARYGLSAIEGDFSIMGNTIFVPDNLPDDPPIFEAPDPPVDADVDTLYYIVKTRADRPKPGKIKNGTLCWVKDERAMWIVINQGWVKLVEVPT